MAQTYSLAAEVRTVTGKKVGQLRRQGLVPAVIYGAKTEPVHIQIVGRDLAATLSKAGGTHLIDVSVNNQPFSVLARQVQRDIIKGNIIHVDFIAVDANVAIEAEVPIQFVNDAPAVKANLGILLQGIQKLTIEALPADLIDSIKVDLSSLKQLGDTIYVRDIAPNANVKIMDDPDEMVVRVIATPAAESEAALDELSSSAEPEVIGKGKKDEEVIDD